MKNQDFQNLFFKYEKAPLLGKNNKNFYILLALFCLTMTTVGFSMGSLDYLKKKMESPFVLWLTVPVLGKDAKKTDKLLATLNQTDFKQKYNYQSVTSYKRYGLRIIGFENTPLLSTQYQMSYEAGRTIDGEDLLLNELFDKQNKIAGRPFKDSKEIGLIVSKRLIEKCGYNRINKSGQDAYPSHIWIDQYVNDTLSIALPLPIIGIVKDLPDASLFAITPFFYNQIIKSGADNYFNPYSYNNESNFRELSLFIRETNQEKIQEVKKRIERQIVQNIGYESLYITTLVDTSSLIPGARLIINPSPEFKDFTAINELFNTVKKIPALKGVIQVYSHRFPYQNKIANNRADFLSVNLNSLEKIRGLRGNWLEEYGLEIDISKIEALENYHFISKLTITVSVILLVFSTISIIFFVNNLLSSYLNSIKSNLGTIYAFGLSAEYLKQIYFRLMAKFILMVFALSFICSVLFGYGLKGGQLFLRTIGGTVEKDFLYFNLFNWKASLSVIVLLFIIFFTIRRTLGNTLMHTPGNLIYKRV